ncbi:recombinase family protein [Acidimicrobium ferrooxidans]|nr:recombinase family protein [Acidimicrobium ferrooxidans]
MSKQKIVGYIRVSTKGQEASGLGLEAQRAAIDQFEASIGGRLIAAYTEVESGRKKQRPELSKAVAHARRSGATIVVAKLDRLGRNVAFLAALLEASGKIHVCDLPGANRMMLQMMMVVAEHEAEAISTRTRDALAAYKARGGKLGASLPQCRNLTPEARSRGAKAAGVSAKAAAADAYTDLIPIVTDLRQSGLTLRAIAEKLNELGHTTRRGKPWNPVQVSRVLGMAA